jgi:polyphosphate kinase 2 (PPK2 family)
MLRTIDLTRSLEREDYKQQILDCQLRLRDLTLKLYRQQRSLIIVVEGWDAAGKGGAIRRLTEKVDPRGYEVYSIGPPEGEDKTHHYLWRFWRRITAPEDKQILIFDRSWYGRVLVERVEGFATEAEWRRAFREINDFERQLTNHRIFLVKLWFHISPDEQLRRFEARKQTPHKSWKLTEEDWRNREKWDQYELAVEDMLQKTSTVTAPWTIIEGNDKYWERVKTQRTVIEALAAELESSAADQTGADPEGPSPSSGNKNKKRKKKG